MGGMWQTSEIVAAKTKRALRACWGNTQRTEAQPGLAGLSWVVQGQSRGWDLGLQLCIVLQAAGLQSIPWHQSVGSWACA